MKTIEEIKNEVALKHGYDNWPDLICQMLHVGWRMTAFLKYENEAIQEYAKQCCDEQIKACAEKYDNSNDELDYYQVIISTPNVAEKP